VSRIFTILAGRTSLQDEAQDIQEITCESEVLERVSILIKEAEMFKAA